MGIVRAYHLYLDRCFVINYYHLHNPYDDGITAVAVDDESGSGVLYSSPRRGFLCVLLHTTVLLVYRYYYYPIITL